MYRPVYVGVVELNLPGYWMVDIESGLFLLEFHLASEEGGESTASGPVISSAANFQASRPAGWS